jgi:hypothetical protein
MKKLTGPPAKKWTFSPSQAHPLKAPPSLLSLLSSQMSSEIILVAKTISSELGALTLKLNQSFPAEELDLSAEQKMLIAVEQQLGKKTLPCKHCGKYEQPLSKFLERFAKYFKDGVLTRVPKSCDKMRTINQKANPFNNPVTNVKAAIKRCEKQIAEAADETLKTQACERLAELKLHLADAEKQRDEWRAANA